MTTPFVPHDFEAPASFTGPGFQLEPLGPAHNERDYAAWTGSIDHIRATPGFPDPDDDWPYPMSLDDNMRDMEMHARHFDEKRGFTYSILNDDVVFGCVYIYPSRGVEGAASVSSWVTEDRAEMDRVVYDCLLAWLADWPFEAVEYEPRP